MGDIRKKYDAALKAKIALEAVKGDKTIREISSEYEVNRKRIQRLMRLMGIEAIYPKKEVEYLFPRR